MGNMKKMKTMILGSLLALLASITTAFAGQPEPWQITLQTAVTPVMEFIIWFEYFTLIIITLIVIFVTVLLAWVAIRYRASKNAVPSKTTHNTAIEIVWTVVPILILVVIAVPSFRLLAKEMTIPEPDLTIKTTGYQWYWGYEYPDHGDIAFDSYMLKDEDREALKAEKGLSDQDVPRLLAVDYDVVVPVNKLCAYRLQPLMLCILLPCRLFGVKMDAIPGRLNETWFKVEKEGIYYGQCSELCGKDHAFMPIAVRAVSQEQFDAWVELAQSDIDAAKDMLSAALAKDKKKLAQLSNQ
jgi:cytochrome c oxidase subunit 2